MIDLLISKPLKHSTRAHRKTSGMVAVGRINYQVHMPLGAKLQNAAPSSSSSSEIVKNVAKSL